MPKEAKERQQLAEQIGVDGYTLRQALFAAPQGAEFGALPAVRIFHQVWLQQFQLGGAPLTVHWRQEAELPPSAQRIHTPYDAEARYSAKRNTTWLGYKVHLTESCDDETPHLITHVLTTPATTPDFDAPPLIDADLAAKQLLPAEHLLDAGYVDAGLLVTSQTAHQVTVIGPVAPDHCWQALTPDALSLARFTIDWDAKRVICPQGHLSQKWSQTHDHHDNPIINIRFAPAHCAACPLRQQCTRSPAGPRHLTLRPQAHQEALQARRAFQTTAAFQERYQDRTGIEGTLSQAVRSHDLRRSRYLGQAKTHLHHLLSAAALNLCRVVDWLNDSVRATTRTPAFVRLALAFP